MGNNQSQEKNQEARLLSEWTLAEQEQIKKYIEQRSFDANNTNGFSADLVTLIQAYLNKQENKIQLLQSIKNLTKYKDSDAIYNLFQQTKQVSLRTFVSWVVGAAVPIWFETGSGYSTNNANQADKLVTHILNYAIDKQNQQKESMSWLNEQGDSQQQQTTEWTDTVNVSPSQISQSQFLNWIDDTPSFKYLLQITIETLLFGKQEATYKRRIEHLASPKIQKHDKKTQKLLSEGFSNLLDIYDYFLLTFYLPLDSIAWSDSEKSKRKITHDLEHTLIFSSKRDGISWQVFANNIVGQGATFVIIKDTKGNKFGGYADDTWEYCNTDWYGNSKNFLFKLHESYGVWDGSSSSNQHFQYLCWGKKSLPNGFGMGGQFDYAGLWIDSDFIHGHSRAGPLCTTYMSPQLSSNETFQVDEVEVWLVRPIERDDNDDANDNRKGVLGNSEDMEFMEMAGKKMYSKDLGPNLSEDEEEEQ